VTKRTALLGKIAMKGPPEMEKPAMKNANVNSIHFGVYNTIRLIHTIPHTIITRCDHITNVLNTIRSFYLGLAPTARVSRL